MPSAEVLPSARASPLQSGGVWLLALTSEERASPLAVVSPLVNFFAGNQEQRGGVRVAAKDLDGDPLADAVALTRIGYVMVKGKPVPMQ